METLKETSEACTADDRDRSVQNPVSAVSPLARFVVHTYTSHSDWYEERSHNTSHCLEEKVVENEIYEC